MAAKPFPKMKVEAPQAPAETPQVVPGEAVKAFTVLRKDGGWVVRTYTVVDGMVVDVQSSEPDLKILALEQFKLAAFKWWTSQ